jgi:hypothetical protein
MAEDTRIAQIASALRRSLQTQGAERVADLDLDLVASDIASAVAGHPRLTPLDPEGDGLTPKELNSANDV